MKELVRKRLAKIGLDFVFETLKSGGPFSNSLDASLESEVWTYVPEALQIEAADFSEGGVLTPEQASEARGIVGELLASFVRQDSSNVVLFEDQLFKLDYPVMAGEQFVFQHEGILYHYRNQSTGTGTREDMEDVLGLAGQYPSIILLTTATSDLPKRAPISGDAARQLIKDVRGAVIGAYDEEGFVVWNRNLGGSARWPR